MLHLSAQFVALIAHRPRFQVGHGSLSRPPSSCALGSEVRPANGPGGRCEGWDHPRSQAVAPIPAPGDKRVFEQAGSADFNLQMAGAGPDESYRDVGIARPPALVRSECHGHDRELRPASPTRTIPFGVIGSVR
jgi:hypothetical protein